MKKLLAEIAEERRFIYNIDVRLSIITESNNTNLKELAKTELYI